MLLLWVQRGLLSQCIWARANKNSQYEAIGQVLDILFICAQVLCDNNTGLKNYYNLTFLIYAHECWCSALKI